MITEVNEQIFQKVNDKNQKLILGVSGASLSLIQSLSNYYSISIDSSIFDRVFERNHYLSQWTIESLLNFFKKTINEIEFVLTINQKRNCFKLYTC